MAVDFAKTGCASITRKLNWASVPEFLPVTEIVHNWAVALGYEYGRVQSDSDRPD